MMIRKIEHIGVAVKDLNEAVKLYQNALNLKVEHIEEIELRKVKIASMPIGESEIELLQATDPEGPIAKYIAERGEGIHHIAIGVDNIEEVLRKLKSIGIELIDEEPRIGNRQTKIAFVHPKSMNGVLLELCERKE